MGFADERHGGSGIKLSNRMAPDCSDSYLQYLEQMGMDCCYAWVDREQANYEFLARLKERAERHHLRLFNIGSLELAKPAAVHLGLPERDRYIGEFDRFLHVLGKVGIPTTTITWEPDNVLSTTTDGRMAAKRSQKGQGNTEGYYCTTTRGNAPTRYVDAAVIGRQPPVWGVLVSRDTIWENFCYFADRSVPAAEDAKVRICLHPNDPPLLCNMGVGTLIASAEDYQRVFAYTDSDYFGMEFCCGCWLEGGDRFGDIFSDIREFVRAGKVSIVHFRNVSSPLPVFTETFLDDGYADMTAIMQCFVDAGYNGTLLYDHTPLMVEEAGLLAANAYAAGYMRGVLQSTVKRSCKKSCKAHASGHFADNF